MYSLKSLLIGAALACAVLGATAPKTQSNSSRDLIDTVMSVHQFDTFLMLVRDADLTFTLKDGGPFTVFAPTDDAFRAMPEGLLEQIHGNKSRLRQFLLHHIVRGSWSAEQAVRARSLPAVDGGHLYTRNVNGHGLVGNASFTITNIHTSNGILHGVSEVLMSR
ncbi:MAG: fasciclin domain-containing protein [Armatimonadetes bacterium]|nr:fasciclin domain-containing protein [Armatimonadota bacterium]